MVTLACLPYEASVNLLAIARTLWRLLLSRRHLLQWNPSSEVERSLGSDRSAEWRSMALAPLFALGVAAALAVVRPGVLPVVACPCCCCGCCRRD